MTVDKRHSIIATRDRNPCATLQQIADKYDITRERVRQVLASEGRATKAIRLPNPNYICPYCGGVKSWVSAQCENCQEAERAKVRWVTLICDQCGGTFERRQSEVLIRAKLRGYQGRIFCSKRCQGVYTAEHYGIGAPNNPIHKTVFPTGRPPKWDYGELYRLRDLTGWGAIRLSRALGIPEGTVSDALRRRQDATETPPNEL